MTAARDPYAVLGLEPGASQAEVKRAYRRLAKVLHPDSAGERSLPAFLAVQEAYERLTGTKVRTVRPPGPASPAGSGPGSSGDFREPWRADPARARAAREQARARGGAGPGPRGSSMPGSTGRASGADATSTGGSSTGGSSAGASGARRRPDPGPASGTARDRARTGTGTGARRDQASGGESSTRRRRATRKATMGSTSYDEARDPTDSRWAGASWYGPTTGEYWIVNPREYADPRKHGPGYSGRVRSGPAPAGDQASDAESGPAVEDSRGKEPSGPRAEAGAPGTSWQEPWTAPRRRHDAGHGGGAAAAEQLERDAPPSDGPPRSGPPRDERPNGGLPGDWLSEVLVRGSSDPLRRLGLVLLAWAPIGIAVAGLIGGLTGCATYSTACDGTDPFLPWVAQAVILGLLLLLAPLARLLAAGTLGIAVGLVPATGLVIALGGAGSSAAGPVLGAVLAIAWMAGVGWGLRRWSESR